MFCLTIQNLHTISVNSGISHNFEAKRRWKLKQVRNLNPLNFASKRVELMAVINSKGHETTVMLTSGASGRINALFSIRAWRSLLMIVNAFFLLLLLPFRRRKAVVAMATGGSQGGGAGVGQGIIGSGKEEKQMEKKSGAVVRVPAAMVPRKSSAMAVAGTNQVAARRSLAIKRVMQDDGKESVREFSLFATARGDTLFTQSWTPISVKVR